jgi:hypothetical protein
VVTGANQPEPHFDILPRAVQNRSSLSARVWSVIAREPLGGWLPLAHFRMQWIRQLPFGFLFQRLDVISVCLGIDIHQSADEPESRTFFSLF